MISKRSQALSRAPFFAACPVCGSNGTRPVVEFPELSYGRCTGCNLIYKVEQQGELGATGYEEDYFRFNRARYLERWEHRVRKCQRQLLACLEYAPQAHDVLDIGCSAGYVLEAARRLGLEPAGLDLSNFAVTLCRERGYRAEQGSLTDMPFADSSFDIITLKHTLEHVPDPMKALREVRRVLRPGGVAFVMVPDAAYYKIILLPRRGRSFRPDRRGWQHHVYFYDKNLADACNRAGLTPLKQGKDIFRRRLARGSGLFKESLRYLLLASWVWVCRVTHFRREIQMIAGKAVQSAEAPGPIAIEPGMTIESAAVGR